VGFLAARAARDAVALVVLEDVAFAAPPPSLPLRRRAAAALAAAAPPDVLARLAAHVARETDLQLVEGAIAGMMGNPHCAAAERALWALGRAPDPIDRSLR
jgi:hypothetical protein